MPNEAFSEYWEFRVNAAVAHLDATRKIIAHKPTRGTIAEHAVQKIVKPVLPFQYGISSGFLASKDADLSRQVDVLVFHRLSSSPIYEDGAFVVISPEMAVMAVEVKSVLTKIALKEAVENVASVKRLNPNILAVLFAFRGFKKAQTLEKHLLAAYAKTVSAFERIDVIINLEENYIAQLDRNTRSTYDCYKASGIAVKTLLDAAVSSAKVTNLTDFIGHSLENPFQTINL